MNMDGSQSLVMEDDATKVRPVDSSFHGYSFETHQMEEEIDQTDLKSCHIHETSSTCIYSKNNMSVRDTNGGVCAESAHEGQY